MELERKGFLREVRDAGLAVGASALRAGRSSTRVRRATRGTSSRRGTSSAGAAERGAVPAEARIERGSDTLRVLSCWRVRVPSPRNRRPPLGSSRNVSEGADTLIPVSCVEHGRWGYRSGRRFAPSPEFAHTRLRAEKTAAVAARRRTVGDAVANQGSVWAEVERRCSRNQPASG